MKLKNLHVSVSGVVVGIALGVAIVTIGGQTSLSANTASVSRAAAASRLHTAPTRADFTQRNIARKKIPLWNDDGTANTAYLTIKQESSVSSAKAGEVTPCDAVRKAVEKIRRVYAVVSESVSNAELRRQMDLVLDDASDDGCTK